MRENAASPPKKMFVSSVRIVRTVRIWGVFRNPFPPREGFDANLNLHPKLDKRLITDEHFYKTPLTDNSTAENVRFYGYAKEGTERLFAQLADEIVVTERLFKKLKPKIDAAKQRGIVRMDDLEDEIADLDETCRGMFAEQRQKMYEDTEVRAWSNEIPTSVEKPDEKDFFVEIV